MAGLPAEQVLGVVLELFSEAYEGASKPYTWFVDNRPDSGLFETLAGISAAKASQAPIPGGSTIWANITAHNIAEVIAVLSHPPEYRRPRRTARNARAHHDPGGGAPSTIALSTNPPLSLASEDALQNSLRSAAAPGPALHETPEARPRPRWPTR
jgi:hypothetical protein